MLLSLAYIILIGLALSTLAKKLHLPGLLGMIIGGILIGPYCLNIIDGTILNVSAELRKIALIIILIRAGLKLELDDLKRVGRPALLMCFVPATFEIAGMIILAPRLLGLSLIEAAVLGTVIAAVSPAVIVPRMIKLIDEGYGVKESIPQMILAGASVDDVYVIVLFTTFTSLAQGESVSLMKFVGIPVSIVTGILAGLLIGYGLAYYFERFSIRDTVKVIMILSISFLLTGFEDHFGSLIPFASLISIMSLGMALRQQHLPRAKVLSARFDKLWVLGEVVLFVLLGASVRVDRIQSAGLVVVLLLAGVLLFRMAGVMLCLLGTPLTLKERLFCMLAYCPKATVQAAIGGIPLSMGLPCGEIVLVVSVMSIMITAPLGALGIDLTYRKALRQSIE